MVKYHILCVTSPLPDALRDYFHLRSLWFCQLQLTWNCDWRPVWVFRHSFTIWRCASLDDEWPNCFLSQKPPYAHLEEVTSHLWCWEPWSLALVCLLSTLALRVRDFSMDRFACLILVPPNPSKITITIPGSWTCFQLNFFSKGSCFFLLWTVWGCSRDLPSTPQIQIWWLAVQTFSKSKSAPHWLLVNSPECRETKWFEMIFSCSTVRNRTISFGGSWTNVTNVASYFWNCCDCCSSPAVHVCL